MKESILTELQKIVGENQVRVDESMAGHTTFRIGGPADFFVTPTTEEAVRSLCCWCREREIPWMVIGNGSNLLVGDKGIRGIVICLGENLSKCKIEKTSATVQAGCLLSRFVMNLAKNGLSGLEFAAGIPGSVGGAVTMNAGAYGGEIKDPLFSATVLLPDGQIKWINKEDLKLAYRHSIIQENHGLVLSACFRLQAGRKEEILEKIREYNQRRREKQPLEYPSAGSTFKRPKGYFAGKLIEEAGLSGICVGGAAISDKHCGFVINKGAATASDVLRLIELVQEKIKERTGVLMEPEVRVVGEF